MDAEDKGFPHHKLDAYKLAMVLARMAREMTTGVPRGYRTVADHLLRSSSAVVLLIAEGASRIHAGEKHHRYAEARGECGEAAAACELLLTFGLVKPEIARAYIEQSARLGAMLTGLAKRFAPYGE